MQGPDYIFALQDKDYNFWKITPSGTVSVSAEPYFIRFSPDGWNDIAIQNIKNKTYKAIDRSVTIPLSYIVDGSKIVKNVFLNRGQFEKLYLVIASQQLDYQPGVSYKYWYKQIYRGQLDWSTYDHTGPKVTCTTLEDGLPKYLKANDRTVYEFPMNVPEAVFVKMDGIRLHESLNYQPIPDFDMNASSYSGLTIVPVTFINAEGDHAGVVVESEQIQSISGLPFLDALQVDNFMIQNLGIAPIIVNVKGVLEFTCTAKNASSSDIRYRFARSNQDFSNQTIYTIAPSVTLNVGQTYTQPFDFDIPLAINEKLFLHHIWNLTGTDCTIHFTENSKFKASFISQYKSTYIRALRAQYVFDLLIDKVTDGAYSGAVSAYLTAMRTKVLTSGNALRGLDDATMKISLEAFFKWLDSIDSVGLIDRGTTVDIAREDDLVDLVNFIDLPEPSLSTFKMTVAKELLINEVEIGFPEIRSEVGVLNGNQEFNNKFLYSTDAQTATARLDKVSPIKCSCYEIEKIRITTFAKDTTDYKNDNDNYALHIEDTLNAAAGSNPAYYNLDRVLNATVTAGLIEPQSVFNLYFSPGRSMERNGSHIRGRFYQSNTYNIYFRSADKNKDLVCNGLVEKANWNIGSFNLPKGLPIYLEGEFAPPDDLLSLLDTNPLQAFRFPVEGSYYYGIMENSGIQKTTRKAQNFKLRSAAINDLTKLEDYYG